jgi:hypothetical protein
MAKTGKQRVLTLTVPVTVVEIEANFEVVTQTAYKFRQKNVYPYIAARGLQVNPFVGPMARRVYISPAVIQHGVVYITGVGHGSYDTFTGAQYDPIFHVGNYSPAEASGKIVHLLSCETAMTLGPDFVKNGCLAFLGYDENFTYDPKKADIFFACDAEIDFALADGATADQAYTRAVTAFDNQAANARTGGKIYTANLLEYNRDHLRAPASGAQWGNGSSKVP